ncbi:MAG: hypothetical protein KDD11_00600 [Acidobacteria bacterium]|nr:hypothetical protein [Acidobacteriota bacterium]
MSERLEPGSPPPASLARLFPEWPGALPSPRDPLVVGRLLEDGEEADLRWLTKTVGEAELACWLGRRGGRQLSRRSRAFWQLLLGTESPPPEIVEELWSF